ncbi:hypothetical protein Tco_0566124 [Tanacetum coccineum]
MPVELGDEALMIQGNRSDGYASIVASEQRAEMFGRIVNVAADALRRKERATPLRVGALVMTINSNLLPQIHEAQVEALKKENVKDKNLHGTDKDFETRPDRTLCIRSRNWLEVSPWKGVIRFGKQGKLNPHYIGPFKILAKIGTVAYKLELREQLSRVYSTFHVSNLKKCLYNETLATLLDEIQINDKPHFIEEPIVIMDREVIPLASSSCDRRPTVHVVNLEKSLLIASNTTRCSPKLSTTPQTSSSNLAILCGMDLVARAAVSA